MTYKRKRTLNQELTFVLQVGYTQWRFKLISSHWFTPNLHEASNLFTSFLDLSDEYWSRYRNLFIRFSLNSNIVGNLIEFSSFSENINSDKVLKIDSPNFFFGLYVISFVYQPLVDKRQTLDHFYGTVSLNQC